MEGVQGQGGQEIAEQGVVGRAANAFDAAPALVGGDPMSLSGAPGLGAGAGGETHQLGFQGVAAAKVMLGATQGLGQQQDVIRGPGPVPGVDHALVGEDETTAEIGRPKVMDGASIDRRETGENAVQAAEQRDDGVAPFMGRVGLAEHRGEGLGDRRGSGRGALGRPGAGPVGQRRTVRVSGGQLAEDVGLRMIHGRGFLVTRTVGAGEQGAWLPNLL